MKKLAFVAVLACLAISVSALAYCDESDYASSHVYVNVVPNISVAPLASVINLGSVQTGGFGTAISFRIDANTEQVKFSAGATKLYKGDITTNPSVEPIALSEGGIVINAESAMPIGGHSTTAIYQGSEVNLLETGYWGRTTEWVTYESSQNNHFSQNVTITPSWVQTDNEKPIGEYSGVVALWAMIVNI